MLVLDDFEALRGSQVPEQLDALLRHPPAQLRLVILSRVDPGLSLPRLHLEDRLTELRSADLAFTCEEVVELLRIAELDLTADDASTLHSRTEGWVAGLRLAVLSLQNHPDPPEFVRTFAGDEHSVADYLVEEVLQRQPEELREFMLRTSVVDLVSAELGDALTGRDDGAELLERLERSNTFLLVARRSPLLVPLPPDVRRAAAQRAAPPDARPVRDSAQAGGPLVRRDGLRSACDQARAGREGHGHRSQPPLGPLVLADRARRGKRTDRPARRAVAGADRGRRRARPRGGRRAA